MIPAYPTHGITTDRHPPRKIRQNFRTYMEGIMKSIPAITDLEPLKTMYDTLLQRTLIGMKNGFTVIRGPEEYSPDILDGEKLFPQIY